MNSDEFQLKMMNVIFESKQGGKPVTVSTFGDSSNEIADFVYCDGCEEFHITLGEPAPEVTVEDLPKIPHSFDEDPAYYRLEEQG